MTNARVDAFISYSSKDKSIARRLAHDLKSAGVDVWFDEYQLMAGDPILHTLRAGIEGADVLLVLLSQDSIKSAWVDKEVRHAFEKHGESGTPTIIPIRIDDTAPPDFLGSIKYIDLRTDYDEGLGELLDVLKSSEIGKVRNAIDTAGLAAELSKDRSVAKGAGFYITSVLSVLTLLVTVITALPAFQQAFGDRPRLYYSATRTQLVIPESLDSAKILKMLEDEGVADSNLQVTIINRGGRDADEIKVGVTVDGELSAFSSTPEASTKPVWVTITPPPIKPGENSATLVLNDLVPDRSFVADFSYYADADEFTCDIVGDGLLAEKVDNVANIPEWSIWQALKTPITVLLIGLIAAVLVGVFIASLTNEKLRDLAFELLDAVSPTLARIINVIAK